jgi:hypothetical protein
MSQRAIVAIVSFCLALTGLFLANMFITMMIGEINRKRQEGNVISYFGFTFPKILRIFDEYHSSYPRGNLHIGAMLAFALGIVALVSVAICLHIIG